MIALIQRVRRARVSIDNRISGEIGQGLLVLVCAEAGDTDVACDRLMDKIVKLRVFSDADGKMNLSVQQIGGGLLIVSQFTLAADTSGGNRPGFTRAAGGDEGRRLYERFIARARSQHPVVATGEFGADMQVELVNDGPVTIPMRVSP